MFRVRVRVRDGGYPRRVCCIREPEQGEESRDSWEWMRCDFWEWMRWTSGSGCDVTPGSGCDIGVCMYACVYVWLGAIVSYLSPSLYECVNEYECMNVCTCE